MREIRGVPLLTSSKDDVACLSFCILYDSSISMHRSHLPCFAFDKMHNENILCIIYN